MHSRRKAKRAGCLNTPAQIGRAGFLPTLTYAVYLVVTGGISQQNKVPQDEKGRINMPVFREDNEEEEDLYDSVNRMADRMGLKGEKRETYVDDHMIQGGYQRVQSREAYARVQQEGEGDESSGNRWGFGSRGRNRQDSSGRRGDDSDRF